MSSPKLPWEQDWTPPAVDPNLLQQVSDLANNVIVAGEQVVSSVATATETALPAAVAPIGGAFSGAIQQAADAALEVALPQIQKKVISAATNALTEEINKIGEPPVPTIASKDLKKVDAWERAGRTFAVGIFVTVLATIVQVIGQASTTGVDFFHKDGWVAVGTLLVGSLITSLSSYVLRIINEPAGAAVDSSTKT